MKVLLVGRTGQVGRELTRTLVPLGDLTALDRSQIDLARPGSIRAAVEAAKPDVIVNAAAYTAVDRAESEQDLAFAVNRDAPGVLAEEAARRQALLVHFSTDYVFDGEKATPYTEDDAPNPLNVYGRSKLAGEEAVRASGCRHLLFRTSWVYSDSGRNFLLTILRLAKGKEPLRVVNDQFGAPTSSLMIGDAVPKAVRAALSDQALCGTYHLTAAGSTTWYGFADALLRASGMEPRLVAITGSEYNAPARRPRNSVLDNARIAGALDIRLPSWKEGMHEVLRRLRATPT